MPCRLGLAVPEAWIPILRIDPRVTKPIFPSRQPVVYSVCQKFFPLIPSPPVGGLTFTHKSSWEAQPFLPHSQAPAWERGLIFFR